MSDNATELTLEETLAAVAAVAAGVEASLPNIRQAEAKPFSCPVDPDLRNQCAGCG